MKKDRKNRGITLIALVITIIVLLVLAGVSIAMLVQDNGILIQTKNAKIITEIETAEEIANLEYSNLLIDYYDKGATKPTLLDIKREMERKNYIIKQIATSENNITGIELSQEIVKVELGGSKEITVTYTGNESEYKYYIEIQGNYYEVILEDEKVKISREKAEMNEGIKGDLQVISDNPNIEAILDGTRITIKDKGNINLTAKITVTYGEYSKECLVVVEKRPNESSEEVEGVTFATNYGVIDIIWLDINNNVISKPNVPQLTSNEESLIPIKWNSSNNIIETIKEDEDWYNYDENKWANAKTKNESYFVWIPRYAYRITYNNGTGYYDGYGQWSAETGKIRIKLDSGIETVDYNGDKYIVHPAFETNLDNGGWDKDLSGMWVAKFEASGIGSNLKFIPGVASIDNQSIGIQYTSARQATYGYIGQKGEDGNTSFMNSHMMKNSEWGAVAYLTHSKYGKNGKEIQMNAHTKYYTGGGYDEYSYISNINQSTTGNTYGIYDLSGGAWETVSIFNSVDNNGYFEKNGWKEATNLTTESESTRYATKYYNNTDFNWGNNRMYVYGKIGDATKEINMGGKDAKNTYYGRYENWFSDYTYIINAGAPFGIRGGYWGNGAPATGIFAVNNSAALGGPGVSFRTVLND